MSVEIKLDKDFSEFVTRVFPCAGEQQLYALQMVWYAGIFCATQELAKNDNLTAVHIVSYDKLRECNEVAMLQTGAKV